MAKDPAFLFYPGDWLGGTMGMTFEEKGAYFELLMLQFNRGHMTSHMIGQAVGQLWDKIKDKFTVDEDGLWYNKRLELEKDNRKKFTNSRKNNMLGVNQHTKNNGVKVGHMTSHMENENKDTVLEEIGSKKIKEIANEVWKDQDWRESICMGLSVTPEELKKWLALFNSSISNDKIPRFDKRAYKKMSRGWIVAQQAKGVKVETGNTHRKSESAPLQILPSE
jgi:uncharacterized protein YdaU (DUF1376 family)